jgi:Phage tail assembly chaperone
MAKLKLQPKPEFKASVSIPVAGEAEALSLEFTFKHRTREELEKFITASVNRTDPETILEMASGWELADAFTAENLALLAQNYIAAPKLIFDKYIDELVKARLGN